MSSHETAHDGLPARSVFRQITMPPVRRRTVLERATMAVRDHAGTGAFMAMLIACVVLLVLSR